MMMVTMVAAVVDHDHHLSLRRIRNCEAEEEHEAEQNLFHDSLSRLAFEKSEQL
jgi:hypothetical protein